MGLLSDFLSGTKTIEEVESPINGKLRVVQDFVWGIHIQGGGLTQSGGVAEKVWREALKNVYGKNPKVKNCLILGLGGGSIAKINSELWPGIKITGIDVDPIIVDLGKKHLGLSEDVEIIIGDAHKVIESKKFKGSSFDLICIDTYVEDMYPTQFEEKEFLEKIKALLSKRGIAVFNRLFYGEKRKLAYKFEESLEKVFTKVEAVYPEANVMYVCSGNP